MTLLPQNLKTFSSAHEENEITKDKLFSFEGMENFKGSSLLLLDEFFLNCEKFYIFQVSIKTILKNSFSYILLLAQNKESHPKVCLKETMMRSE